MLIAKLLICSAVTVAVGRIVFVAALAFTLSGCATKPLKAPCSPREGGLPLSYAPAPSPSTPEAFRFLDPCGPMRRI